MVTIKKELSAIDKQTFAAFRKRYPRWQIYRLTDNSMLFVPPNKEVVFPDA